MKVRGAGLFAFSTGLALLSAEVVWNRTLLVVTGGSTDSTMVVLSAVMAGLAAGGLVFGRLGDSALNPVRALRMLSLASAPAFLLPLILSPLASRVYPGLASAGIPMTLVRAAVSFAMILLPAFLGGGLIPLMARLVERGSAVAGIAGLYALNALGSALGGLLTGFVLLELLGAGAALSISVLLMVVSAFVIHRGGGNAPVPHGQVPSPGGPGGPRVAHLALFALSGMIALSFEAVWSRQLTFILGNSTYAFSAMGASALAGMSLGSWIGRRLHGPALPLFGIAVSLEGLLGVLPLVAASTQQDLSAILPSLPGYARAAMACLSMIPASACMGATFPLMVRAAGREERLSRDVGTLSMANSLGASAGPFFASIILISGFGPTRGTAVLAALAAVAGASAALIGRSGRRAVLALCMVIPAAAFPLFLPAPGSRPPADDLELAFFDEDRAATVSVFSREWDDYRSLRINGVEEVPVDQASMEAFQLLGHLPWGYNPSAGSALVIALGGGITSGALLSHPVESLVCVEICPSVVEALPLFAAENHRPDLDPRFTLVGDDGRNFLAASTARFDLIVCDATHPGSSDSWVLYTEEFYRSVLEHLSQEGVAAQWVPLHQLPVRDLEMILATWNAVFPCTAVHLAGGRHAVLIGSAEALDLDIEAMFAPGTAGGSLRATGFSPGERLFLDPVARGPGIGEATAGVSLNTDDHAPCQFIRRRAPVDPQATIAPCVAFLLSIGGGSDPLRDGQVLYWSGRLPEAVEVFRTCRGPMGDRWLSLALTSAAEGFAARGETEAALRLVSEAMVADPGWARPGLLREALGETR